MQLYSRLDKNTHGTLDFPVEYYYVDSTHPRYQMSFHWHKEWELMRVVQGTFQISIDDKQYSLSRGDILLIPGETLHGGEPTDCVYECLDFDLYALFNKLPFAKPYLRPFYRKNYLPQTYFPAIGTCKVNELVGELMACFKGECPELDAVCYIGKFFRTSPNTNCTVHKKTRPTADGPIKSNRFSNTSTRIMLRQSR